MFLNEYRLASQPEKIFAQRAAYSKLDPERGALDYLFMGQLSRLILQPAGAKPVAPLRGDCVVSEAPIADLPDRVTIQGGGRVMSIEVRADTSFEILPSSPDYLEALRAITNRKIDIALGGLLRDGRTYFERTGERHGEFQFRQGAYVAAKTASGGISILIDPTTQFSSTLTLFEMLEKDLRKLGVSHWREIPDPKRSELNRRFRSRAFNLRTDYTEANRWGEEESKRYRFVSFDFSRSISDPLEDGAVESPLGWHTKMGRASLVGGVDQPVVTVRAKGGFSPSQIPSLLRVAPDMMALRIVGLSKPAQNIAQKAPSDRVGAMLKYAKLLAKAGLIGDIDNPIEVTGASVAPIQWTLENDYLEIRGAADFRKYFSKAKLLRKPTIAKLVVFCEKGWDSERDAVIRVLERIARRFKVDLPEPAVITLPSVPETWLESVRKHVEGEAFGLQDLAILLISSEHDYGEGLSFHDQVKRYSLTERVFPTQFIILENVRQHLANSSPEEVDAVLASELMNLLFKQIVAKCGGVPHGLASGFASRGTVFVGADRFKDHFGFFPSSSAAVSVFNEHGEHISSVASVFDRDESDHIHELEHLLDNAVRAAAQVQKVQKIVFLRDGVPQRNERREYEALRNVANRLGAAHIFVEAPKSTPTRLYGGEPDETGYFAEKAPPFTVVTELPGRPSEILVLSTDPWRGTPRPMLYRLADMSASLNLQEEKELLARSIAWLCTHSWVSPVSTRLPVPLHYADKMAEVSGHIGMSMNPAQDRPLFL